jgi:hypothetical protein
MHRLPGALPTDPDVRDYLIRFLGSNPFDQIRSQTAIAHLAHNFAALQTNLAVVVDPGLRKRKFVKNRVYILFPVYVAFVGSSTQPISPVTLSLMNSFAKHPDVTNNSVVLIVTPEFNA